MTSGDWIILIFATIGAFGGFGSGYKHPDENWRQAVQRTALGAFIGAVIALFLFAIAIANGWQG